MKRYIIRLLAIYLCSFSSISTLTAQGPELILPIGHSAPIIDAVCSPDGKRIATSSNDKTVRIWDAESGILLLVINDFALKDSPENISFSPDGKSLMTICGGIRINLWDSYTGKLLLESSSAGDMGENSGEAFLAALFGIRKKASFSPDGKLLIISEEAISIWDIQSRKMILTFKGPEEGINSFTVSPDSKYILTNSVESSIDLWEISSGKLIRNFSSGNDFSTSYGSFTPDGKQIITRSEGEIKLWDLQSGKIKFKLNTIAGSRHCLSPDGSKILADGNLYLQKGRWVESSQMNTDSQSDLMGQIVGLYDAISGKVIVAFVDSSTIKDNIYVGDYLQVFSLAFSPDQKKIITVTDKCRIWDAQKGTLLFSIEGFFDNSTKAAFSQDGKRIFLASGAFCGLYDADDGSLISPFVMPAKKYSDDGGIESQYPSAGFSPDGKNIYLVPDFSNYVNIYDPFSGELKTSLSGSIIPVFEPAFSSDGSTFVTKSIIGKFEVRSWDLKNGKLLNYFTDKEMGHAFYPQNGNVIHTFFFTMPDKITIKSYHIQTGMLLNTIAFNANPFGNFIFSPDEKTITVIDTSFNAKILDAKTGAEKHILPWPVGDAIYSPDGKNIITTSWENFAKQYDVQSGKMIRELKDPEASEAGNMFKTSFVKGYDSSGNDILGDTIISRGTITARFSSDGKRLINTGSLWDNTTRIWNLENGRLLNRFEGTDGSVNNDGTRVITQIYIEDTLNFISKTFPVVWDADNGRQLFKLDPLEWGYSVFSPDGKNIVTSDFGDTIKIWDAATFKLRRKIVPDGELLNIDWKNDRAILNENSRIVFYSIGTGEKLFSLLVMDSLDYLIVTPDNYYIGSENAIKKLYWMVEGQLYPYDKYDLQYNRPDIVLERLGNTDTELINSYRQAYEKRLKSK